MDDSEGINRREDSGRKTVLDRDSLRDAIRSTPSTRISLKWCNWITIISINFVNKFTAETKQMPI